jgi:hypothetical protein
MIRKEEGENEKCKSEDELKNEKHKRRKRRKASKRRKIIIIRWLRRRITGGRRKIFGRGRGVYG